MMVKILFISLLVCVKVNALESAKQTLEYMTLTYSQVEYMKSNFSKKSTSTLLGNTEKSSGALEYSKGKFRIDLKDKKRNIFIKGEKSFWHINDKTVIKGEVSQAVPTVFEAIFSNPKVWSGMESRILKKDDKFVEIKVDTKNKVPNISEMILKINHVKKTLVKLSYTDDVNNSVEIDFKSIRFFEKSKPNRFLYEIKASDEVSEM